MSGAGLASAGMLVQYAWDFIASRPSIIFAGAAVFLGLLVLKGLWPSSSPAPTGRTAAATATATSSNASGHSGSEAEPSPTPDDPSTDVDEEQDPVSASTEEDRSDTSVTNESREIQPEQPSEPTEHPSSLVDETVIDDTVDPVTENRRSRLDETRTVSTHRPIHRRIRRKQLLRQAVDDHPSTWTQLRRHMVDGVDVNTGFDWVTTDYRWSAVELDLGVNGGSIDASGEFIYADPLPPVASTDIVDSPVDLSSPSLLRLLSRLIAPPSNPEPQTDKPQTQSNDPGKSHRVEAQEFHQQQPARTAPDEDYQSLPDGDVTGASPREFHREDQHLSRDDSLKPGTDLDPGRGSYWQSDRDTSLDTGSPDVVEEATSGVTGPSVKAVGDSALPAENMLGGAYLESGAQEEPAAGTGLDSFGQERREKQPVGVDYEYSPPQWTPPQVDPPTVDVYDERSRGSPEVDAAAPITGSVNPLADMGRGLEALGIDSTQIDPDPSAFDAMLETDPPDDVGDIVGFGDVTESFEDKPLLPGLPTDTDAEPLLPGMDETFGAWNDEGIRF